MTSVLNYTASISYRQGRELKQRVFLGVTGTGVVYIVVALPDLNTPPAVLVRYMVGAMLSELMCNGGDMRKDTPFQGIMALDGGGSGQLYLSRKPGGMTVNDGPLGKVTLGSVVNKNYHPINHALVFTPW